MIFFVNSAYQRSHRCLDLTVVVFHTFVLICQLNLSFSLCERRSYERFLGYFALHLYSKTKTFMELALQFSWTLSITGSGTDALLVPDRSFDIATVMQGRFVCFQIRVLKLI